MNTTIKKRKVNQTIVAVRMTLELRDRLESLAYEYGITMSSVIKTALVEHLKTKNK